MDRIEIAIKIITSDIFKDQDSSNRIRQSFELTDSIIDYHYSHPEKIDNKCKNENWDIELCNIICRYFKVNRMDLNLPIKTENISTARQFCWYWFHFYYPQYTLKYLALYFKHESHTAPLYAIRQVSEQINIDPKRKKAHAYFLRIFQPDVNALQIYNEHIQNKRSKGT